MASPVCRHFGPCGGCDWQHLAYAEQLAAKRDRLAALLQEHAGLDPATVSPVIGMQTDDTGWPWRFRHKAAFAFGTAADRGLLIGHYAAASNDVIPIAECPVHADRANRLAFALHDHLSRAGVSAAGPALKGVLRHLIVRTTRDGREIGAMLVVTRNDRSLRKPIRAFLATEEAPDGFYLNVHERPGPYMVGPATMRLAGRSHVKETVNGVGYLLSPTAFFQTNVDAAEIMVRLVLEAVGRDASHVLDLYSGSGLFTIPLAARGHAVTAVEESRQAIEDLDANLRLNRVANGRVRLDAARVEDALRRYARDRFDAVILDPPRQGCASSVLRTVVERIRPRRLVYVSCNAEALAGELPAILSEGYVVDGVQPIDMFPHTTHIETVVTLCAAPSPGTRGRAAARPRPPTRPRPRH